MPQPYPPSQVHTTQSPLELGTCKGKSHDSACSQILSWFWVPLKVELETSEKCTEDPFLLRTGAHACVGARWCELPGNLSLLLSAEAGSGDGYHALKPSTAQTKRGMVSTVAFSSNLEEALFPYEISLT